MVGASQQNYSFDRKNTKKLGGSITLNKTGLGSTDTAGFTLYDSAGAAVGGEKTVIGNGSVSWTYLAWDTYKIVETTIPAGYNPIADITGIVVGASQQNYSFDRKNTPPPPDEPEGTIEVLGFTEVLAFTGMHPAVLISGISFVIAGVLLLLISISRKKRRKLEI